MQSPSAPSPPAIVAIAHCHNSALAVILRRPDDPGSGCRLGFLMTIAVSARRDAGRSFRCGLAAASALALVLGAGGAHAAGCGFQICDDRGILGTFVGAAGDDLDVVGASAFFDSHNVTLTAKMADTIGKTTGGFYVWGVDTGSPIDFFKAEHDNPQFKDANGVVSPDPLVGVGVNFDTFIVLSNTGAGSINYFDPNHKSQTLAAGAVTISGDTISVVIPEALLFSTNGKQVGQYGYNIWPRNGGFRNDQVTDFAPDHSNFQAQAVPEPAAWALLIAGFGFAGSSLRRRRVLHPA